MNKRLECHYQLSTSLSFMSDSAVTNLFENQKSTAGWGLNHIIDHNSEKVFVKRIPLTDLEVENAYSTRNLYRLPTWYNYGVGSAGFGGFRELATHVKTTNWVRAGLSSMFPLLHHHRILPVTSDGISDEAELEQYVRYWGGSKNIGHYMRARANCQHQLVLFIEYLTPFENWIMEHPKQISSMLTKALRNVDVLHAHGIIHFDAHTKNWLTNGKDLFLSDFGLALDREFELTPTERKFFERHRYYDYGQVISSIGPVALISYFALDDKAKALIHKELGAAPGADFRKFMYILVPSAVELHGKGLLKLPGPQRRLMETYGEVIQLQTGFFRRLLRNNKRSTPYPCREMQRLLSDLNVIA